MSCRLTSRLDVLERSTATTGRLRCFFVGPAGADAEQAELEAAKVAEPNSRVLFVSWLEPTNR
jgi:hypothetical protein